MTRRTYPGLAHTALSDFEALKPLVDQLRALQRRCRPFGRDYHAIAVSLEALETTAYHFTRRPGFYGSQSDSVGPVRPPVGSGSAQARSSGR